MRLLYETGAGGITCVSLLVGRLCSHRACSPLLLITVSTYLPSGEMAVSPAWPELVTWVIVKFWKWATLVRCSSEYTPNTAAARTVSPATAIPVAPHLCCFTAATTAELPCCCAVGDAGGGAATAEDVETAGGVGFDSVSRFNRFRSARISAATW